MAFVLTVACTPAALKLKPGGSAFVDVAIGNVSDIVEHYDVTVVGLPSEYLTSSVPDGPKLKPRQSATVRLTITLPAKGGIPGGHYVLGVLVASRYTPGVRRAAEVVLDVEAVSDLTLTPQPQVAHGRNGARFTVAVSNQGNTYVTLALAAQDDQGKAEFDIQPPSMTVPPNQPGSFPFEVDVRVRGALSGPERHLTITFAAHVDGETRAEEPVTLVQRPLVPAGLVRALGAAAAVLLMVGAVAAGLLLNGRASDKAAAGSSSAADASPSTAATAATSAAGSQGPSTAPPSAPKTEGPSSSAPSTSASPPPVSAPDRTAEEGVSLGTGDSATGTATCPEGTVVLGGGVEVDADPGVVPATAVMASSPEDGQQPRRWRVSLRNEGAAKALATVRATCAPKPAGYSVTTVVSSVTGSGYAEASCKQGRVVLGGGGGAWTDEATADPGTTLLESRPVQVDGQWAAWRVALRSAGAGSTSVRVFALCADPLSRYQVVPQTPAGVPALTPGPKGAELTANARCPDDMRALSGGVGDEDPMLDQSVDPGTAVAQSTLAGDSSEDAESGWVTSIRSSGAAKPGLTMFAVCGDPDPA